MKSLLVSNCFSILTLLFTVNSVLGESSRSEECVPDPESYEVPNANDCVMTISKNEFVLPGKTIKLTCPKDNRRKPSYVWYKNAQRIVFPDRITQKNNPKSLIIKHLDLEDNGVYTCLVWSDPPFYQYHSINLEVQFPPYFTFAPEVIKFVEWKTAKLKCQANGSPKPEIKWLRDGKEINDRHYEILESGDLQIQNAWMENAGEYKCRAANAHGSVETTIRLEMEQPIKITDSPKNSELNAGDTATFRCSAVQPYSKLKLRIDWLKNGVAIDIDSELRIFLNADNTVLTIIKVSEIDSGTYTCVASTDIDEARAQAKLVVYDVPKPPKLLGVDCGAREARVSWNATSEDHWPITHYTVEYKTIQDITPYTWQVAVDHIPATNQSYNVKLPLWANYSFRVIAWNQMGASQPSSQSSICTPIPDVPYKNPDNVRTETYIENLYVMWSIMPPIEQNAPNFTYRVYYKRDVPGENWTVTDVDSWETDQYVIHTLGDYQKYKIKVAAVNEIGECREPPQEIVGFVGEDVPLQAPANFTVEKVISGKTALVSWSKITYEMLRGPLNNYEIEYWIEKDGEESLRKSYYASSNETSILLDQLIPSRKNYLRIRARTIRSQSPFSEVISVDTPDEETTAVADFNLDPINSTTMMLNWSKPISIKGKLTGYQITIQDAKSQMESHHKIEGPESTSTSVSGLTPQTKYRIIIRAITSAGEGQPSSEEKMTPAPRRPEKPTFKVHEMSQKAKLKTLKIVRDVKHDNIPESYFFVEYHMVGESTWKRTGFEKKTNEIVISSLETGHTYVLYVIAVNEGCFTESDRQEVTI